MGAVTFSLDLDLVNALKEALPLDVFVETGTFQGDTVELVKDCFLEIHTVELSQEYYDEARARFAGERHIDLIQGDSAAVLAELAPKLRDRSVLYYLDAHWCVAENTAGAISQCPLINEIRAISSLNSNSLIVIDDARFFLAPPTAPHDISQWPRFHQVVSSLLSLSTDHELMVVNDVIAFFPKLAGKAIEAYAQKYGIDWLSAAGCLKENRHFLSMLEEKEAFIQHQASVLTGAQAALAQKDIALADTQAALAQKDIALADTQAALAQKDIALANTQAALAQKDIALADTQAALAEKDRALVEVNASHDEQFRMKENQKTTVIETSELERKEAVIQELARAVKAYRMAHFLLSPKVSCARIISRLKARLAPRLGNLNQHSPVPVQPIAPYVCVTPTTQLPVISLITPSYNQGHFIERTIRSVLDQGYPKIEYVVQDGGSSDDTVSVLKKYGDRLAGWDSNPDNGQSHALNLGFARTTGEIMGWLNSDDVLLPGTLSCVADYFARHSDVDVVYGNRLLINEDDMNIGRWILPGHDSEALSWADYVPQETLFWRRSLWEKTGGKIDESFRFAMDWDLLVRFRDAGARFAHIPRFLGAFRIHIQQKTSAAIGEVGFQEMDSIRERIHGRVPSRKEIRKAVMPFLARHAVVDLIYRIKTRIGGKR